MAKAAQESANSTVSEEEHKRQDHQKQAVQEWQRQALSLQRENILSQRTSNPNRRAALEDALKMIEGQLAQLG